MGSGASALVEGDSDAPGTLKEMLLSLSSDEKPSDASDITDLDGALEEVRSLRSLARGLRDEMETDDSNRLDLISQKLDHQSFRGGSLNMLLSQSLSFVNLIVEEGYSSIPASKRYAGLRTLSSFLKSPALNVMLARKNVQEDLRKRVESHADEEINEYIIGHYASSGSVHDVSMIRERAKTKFGNAMKKLKGQFLLAQLIGDKKKQKRKRTSSFIASSPHLTHLKVSDQQKRQLDVVLMKMDDFEFDVWDLVPITNNQPLLITGLELFKRWELDTRLEIKDELTAKFFVALEKGYMANPYHNNVHGADVMYTVNSFIQASTKMHDCLEPLDLFAALVAAAAHDFKHDGVNNAFHINTSSDLALRYNDLSVLENMHAAELYLMCKDSNVNIFSAIDPNAYKEVRKIITNAILGTDMTKHFNHIADFESRLSVEKSLEEHPEHLDSASGEQRLDKLIMIEMALHCADISNPVKDISIYKKWVMVVMTEFYQQGDKERELGMAISPMFDRNNSSVTKTQCGFIDFIIRPIYRVWGEFIPELNDTFNKNMDAGKAFDWDTFYKEGAKQASNSIAEEEGDVQAPPEMVESASAPVLQSAPEDEVDS